MKFSLEKYDHYFRFSSVLTFVAMAAQHFRLWAFPDPSDREAILTQSVLMAFEFIMVHSGLFMIVFSGSRRYILVLVIFYGLFAIAFNFALPNSTVLYTYMFVVMNRVRFLFYHGSKEAKINLLIYSAVVTFVYFIMAVGFAVIGRGVPPLGVTRTFLESIHYYSSTRMTGMFVERPQVGLAFGTFYFLMLAFLEFKMIRNKGKLFVTKETPARHSG